MRRRPRKKRPFYAVRNLLRLLDEPDGAYTPGSLKYRLTASTNDVERLLLQKKDGTFYLILWRETKSVDYATASDLNPPPASVRLTFEEPIRQVQVFRPSAIDVAPDDALKPRRTVTAPTAVSLDVPDHLVVVKIS